MDQEQNHRNIPNCQNFAEAELTTQQVELMRLRSDVSVQAVCTLHTKRIFDIGPIMQFTAKILLRYIQQAQEKFRFKITLEAQSSRLPLISGKKLCNNCKTEI